MLEPIRRCTYRLHFSDLPYLLEGTERRDRHALPRVALSPVASLKGRSVAELLRQVGFADG
jgi:hypothetical protein